MEKLIIYQIFTRLFGNATITNIPHGSITENGCGKFNAFTPKVLKAIKQLGITHVWYTGILEHATQTNYTHAGIEADPSSMVKGKAGSPYAIKDYYDVDPDLAVNVEQRMHEFEALVARTHKAGLQLLIDFVPNHVARHYHSDAKPANVNDFGANDRTDWHFYAQNNFYYCPNTSLEPQFEVHNYVEYPAKATGNDCFSPNPSITDWYETVKLNYGVDYTSGHHKHFDPTPDTWFKMRDILLFWAGKQIDGFRCDMAEMVPVEFWHWVIPQVKQAFPNIIFIAEVYNPALYRSYIFDGGFDYLYDKVGLYDQLRAVTCGTDSAAHISQSWQSVANIQPHMLNFLENHDEQRLASDFFAGDAQKGKAGMIVASCMNTNPVMIYAGQELGERGMDAEGFSGRDGRTTIFDYWHVDTLGRWYHQGKIGNALLTSEEQELQQFYSQLLNTCLHEKALSKGLFFDLMYANMEGGCLDPHRQYVFLRAYEDEAVLVVANFSDQARAVAINLPQHAFDYLHIEPNRQCEAVDLLTNETETICVSPDQPVETYVAPWGGKLLKFKH